jgi:hypothetical protein
MSTKNKGGAQAPRMITPHKGGRTERIFARCTPETLAAVKATGVSVADFIEWAVAEWKNQNTPSTPTGSP